MLRWCFSVIVSPYGLADSMEFHTTIRGSFPGRGGAKPDLVLNYTQYTDQGPVCCDKKHVASSIHSFRGFRNGIQVHKGRAEGVHFYPPEVIISSKKGHSFPLETTTHFASLGGSG